MSQLWSSFCRCVKILWCISRPYLVPHVSNKNVISQINYLLSDWFSLIQFYFLYKSSLLGCGTAISMTKLKKVGVISNWCSGYNISEKTTCRPADHQHFVITRTSIYQDRGQCRTPHSGDVCYRRLFIIQSLCFILLFSNLGLMWLAVLDWRPDPTDLLSMCRDGVIISPS